MTNPQNKKNTMKKGKKIALTIVVCLSALVLVVALTVTSLFYFGKKSSVGSNVTIIPSDKVLAEMSEDNTVTYNGKKYRYNDNISTILCIGVDNTKRQSGGAYVTGRAGQADAIYLIAVDTKTGKTSVIGIPRDSVTDVDLYSSSGTFIGTEKTQICLSFAYGDGKHKSAENTAKSVSRFLYGMPVNSYFAVDDAAMKLLHNAVGNIKVIPNETIKTYAIEFYKGQPFTVTGNNVFTYLQSRNDKTTDASLLRLERQTDYLKKYTKEVTAKTKGDITFPVKLYNKVIKNAVTDINVSKITYLASEIFKQKDNTDVDFIKIEGKQTVGEDNFAEFYPYEEKLFETVLQVFYKEID